MKTTLSLLMAFGLAAPAALAQTSTTQQGPQGTQETPAQSDFGMPPQPEITSPSSSGSSGAASGSQSSSQPDTPAGSSSSTSGTPIDSPTGSTIDSSSGASSPMQSEAGMDLRPAPDLTDRLEPVVQNDVTYLCGGVGEEEVRLMKQQAKAYDLMLTFAARDGSYLADVDVDIQDAKGNSVLQASCDSPILLVDLPKSGNYRVRADAAGYTLNKTVKVTAAKRKGQHLASTVLTWPQQVAEAADTGATSSGSGEGSSGSDNENNSNSNSDNGSSDNGKR